MRYFSTVLVFLVFWSAAAAQEVQLRTFENADILTALRSGALVDAQKAPVQMLGFARVSQNGAAVEISADCGTWTEIATEDVATMRETLVPSESCGDQTYPYVKLTLKRGVGSPGSVIAYSVRMSGGNRFGRPSLAGGGLAISDTIIEFCTDTYLSCQLEECGGKGQWCEDMCNDEFDFCIADR